MAGHDYDRHGVTVFRLGKSGYILYQAILSAVLAAVLFCVAALMVLALDAKGALAAIGSLMGSALGPITASRLISLSAIFAICIGCARLLIHVCLAWVKDAALMISGGITVAAEHTGMGRRPRRTVAVASPSPRSTPPDPPAGGRAG